MKEALLPVVLLIASTLCLGQTQVSRQSARSGVKDAHSAAAQDLFEKFDEFTLFGECEKATKGKSGRTKCRLQTCDRRLREEIDRLIDVQKTRQKLVEDTDASNGGEAAARADSNRRAFERNLARTLPTSQLEDVQAISTVCEKEALASLDDYRKSIAAEAGSLSATIANELEERGDYKQITALVDFINSENKKDADKFDDVVKQYNGRVDKYNRLLADYNRAADAYNALLSISQSYLQSQRSNVSPVNFPTYQPAPPPIHCSAFTLGNTTSINCQ